MAKLKPAAKAVIVAAVVAGFVYGYFHFAKPSIADAPQQQATAPVETAQPVQPAPQPAAVVAPAPQSVAQPEPVQEAPQSSGLDSVLKAGRK